MKQFLSIQYRMGRLSAARLAAFAPQYLTEAEVGEILTAAGV